MVEGELYELIKELRSEVKKHPNHEFGRLETIRLKLDEVKEDFPDKRLLTIQWDNEKGWIVPPDMPYPDGALWSIVQWFRKCFGERKHE